MKKYQFLLAGLMMFGFAACDDAPEVALPQENPQGPVLEGITGTTASPTSTMTAGIDLQQLIDDQVETLSLYTLNAGESGLEQSSLSGFLEISNSESFEKVVSLNPVEGVQGTVSVEDLNEAYTTLFGRAPQTSTVYYRVPMYTTLNGTTYRIGSLDFYGSTGTFEVTAPDPGFNPGEKYYLIGDLNGWSASQAALDQCQFTHSSASVYDDPTFSYSFETESAVYWKIVPGDVYDSMGDPGFSADDDNFWGLLIGVETDGSSEKSGDLIQTNAQAAMVPAGTWTITINMETWTYEVTGFAAGGDSTPWALDNLYFRGGFTDDWGAYSEYQFVLTSTDNEYVNPFVALPAGINFKVADSDWGLMNFGVGTGTLSFGTAYEMVYNAGDIAIPGEFNGSAIVVVAEDGQTASLTMTQFESATAGQPSGIYLRGGMNGWGAEADWEFQTTAYKGVYELNNVTISAGEEFKAADESWGTVNNGGIDGVDITFNGAVTLEYNAGNLVMPEDFNGTVRLVYNSAVDRYFIYFLN